MEAIEKGTSRSPSTTVANFTYFTVVKVPLKKLDGNYTRMLQAILNKSWQQHPTRHQLYGHLPPIMKTIQPRWTRHAGHCWRSKDVLISDVLLWTPAYGQTKAGWPDQTYRQQLCEDTGCSPEDLPEVMNDRGKWRERVQDFCTSGTIWWWWCCRERSWCSKLEISFESFLFLELISLFVIGPLQMTCKKLFVFDNKKVRLDSLTLVWQLVKKKENLA